MLPAWLQAKLASPPAAGAGVHAWLFSVARQLHAHMPPEAVEAALAAATTNVGRRVSHREIHDAVKNSFAVAWQPQPQDPAARGGAKRITHRRAVGVAPAPGLSSSLRERWPVADPVTRRCRIADAAADGVGTLGDLWNQSPCRPSHQVDDWLDWLFPNDEWLCLAADHPASARSRRRNKWTFGPAEKCSLIVPSPMTGPSGRGLDGRISHRCLDNTGPRRWLVIEFDSGTLDEQAALHWHLRAAAEAAQWPRLTLCVHSGSKSLHGWFGICREEDHTRELMAYAISLGADPATWNRCQMVRLPGGIRQKRPRGGLSTSNAERPTPNAQVTGELASTPWKLGVGRWALDVQPAAGGSEEEEEEDAALHQPPPTPQEVFYFDPFLCPSPTNSSGPGGPPGSMRLPDLMAG